MRRRHATQAGMLYGRHSDVFPHPDEGVTVVATSDLAALESRAAELEAALRALVDKRPRCTNCDAPAVLESCDWSGDHVYGCDACGGLPDMSDAAPLRVALLLLAKGGAP